jgi:hypothetical protein
MNQDFKSSHAFVLTGLLEEVCYKNKPNCTNENLTLILWTLGLKWPLSKKIKLLKDALS